MEDEKTKRGLEALAGDVPLLPAKASSPALFIIHYSLFIISVPQNYREKSQLYLEVAKQIRDFRTQIPIDLIVYTKPMYQQFIEQGSQFSKEILQKGVLLYEVNHSRMA